MSPIFVFVIALVTNSGEMEMKGYYVNECPDNATFTASMEERRTQGEFKDWHALCVEQKPSGQDT